jgi:hypothetical protein
MGKRKMQKEMRKESGIKKQLELMRFSEGAT